MSALPRPFAPPPGRRVRRTAARGSVLALAAGLLAGAPLAGASLARAAEPAPVETPTGTRVAPLSPGTLYPDTRTDSCGIASTDQWGWLPGGTSSLTATLNGSSAALGAEFHVRDTAAPNTDVLTGRVGGLAPGTQAEFALDPTKLVEGHAYSWNVVGTDADGNRSAATTDCHFRVDHRGPRISLLSTSTPQAGTNRLTFQVQDSYSWERIYTSGHGCLEYRTGETGPWTRASCGWPGSLSWPTVDLDVPLPQPNSAALRVRDVDQAGNYSAEVVIPTFAYPGQPLLGDLADPQHQWQLGRESPGSDAAGTAPLAAGPGVTWVDNHSPFTAPDGSSTPGPATVASLDGTGALSADRPLIDTRESFTVTAWAKPTAEGGVVLSQQGARSSAFALWADPSDGRWHAALGRQDDDSWSYDQVTPYAAGRDSFTPGVWNQLSVAYNARTEQISLQVNGTVVATGHHAARDSFQATGAFQLGQYRYQGEPNARFKGELSDVAVLRRAAAPPQGWQSSYRLGLDQAKCATAAGSPDQPGAPVRVANCGSSSTQSFTSHSSDGTLRWGNLCLDAYANGTANGAATTFWTCNGGGNQVWLPRTDGSLLNPQSGRCLDLPWGNTTDGTRFVLWDCNGGANQRFDFTVSATRLV
ncbi:ricin-type beta-trefoil lectin domain protein [Kitasatospora sp. NPDC002551]|uniref:ricin-type beta-trefoil lectin domain protein n=1 Tax=Kitasatospora sp. NPDC002551 TaxID=3154539 RepID=UPI00331D0545